MHPNQQGFGYGSPMGFFPYQGGAMGWGGGRGFPMGRGPMNPLQMQHMAMAYSQAQAHTQAQMQSQQQQRQYHQQQQSHQTQARSPMPPRQEGLVAARQPKDTHMDVGAMQAGTTQQEKSKKKSYNPDGTAIIPRSLREIVPKKYHGAFAVGDTPEEIERWRAERRKHYPSAQNIEKKKLIVEEQQRSGQLVPEENTGKMRVRKPSQQTETDSSKRQRVEELANDARMDTPATVLSPSTHEEAEGPTGEEGKFITDAEAEPPQDVTSKSEAPLSSQGATTESKSETRLGIAVNERSSPARKTKFCKLFAKGKCRHGDQCRFSHDPQVRAEELQKKAHCKFFLNGHCRHGDRCKYIHDKQHQAQTAIENRKNRLVKERHAAVQRQSLLYKVLAKDLTRETSFVLEMFRYFLTNHPTQSAEDSQD